MLDSRNTISAQKSSSLYISLTVRSSFTCFGHIQNPYDARGYERLFETESEESIVPGRDASGRLIPSQIPHGAKHTSRRNFSNFHSRNLYCSPEVVL